MHAGAGCTAKLFRSGSRFVQCQRRLLASNNLLHRFALHIKSSYVSAAHIKELCLIGQHLKACCTMPLAAAVGNSTMLAVYLCHTRVCVLLQTSVWRVREIQYS
jgi:hypothetical protein